MQFRNILLLAVFAISFCAFKPFQAAQITKLKNGNYDVPENRLKQGDLKRLLKLSRNSVNECVVMCGYWNYDVEENLSLRSLKAHAAKSETTIFHKTIFRHKDFDKDISKSMESEVITIMDRYLR